MAVGASRPRCRDRRIGPCPPLTAELPAGSWRPTAPASPCRPTGSAGPAQSPTMRPQTMTLASGNPGRVHASEQPADGTSDETAPVAPSSRQGAREMTGSATTSRFSIAPSAVIAWRSRLRPVAQSTRPAARPSASACTTRSRGCRSSRAATPPSVHCVPRAVRRESARWHIASHARSAGRDDERKGRSIHVASTSRCTGRPLAEGTTVPVGASTPRCPGAGLDSCPAAAHASWSRRRNGSLLADAVMTGLAR
jgi:hypothetical protein